MSGLFGTIEFASISREELQARTQAAIRSLAQRGLQENTWFSDCGRVALAQCSDILPKILTSASGRSRMVFDGEIYNNQELREQYPELPETSDDRQLFLEFLESRGTLALPLLEGMFAGAIFDQSQRKIFLSTDHAGQRPLYVYQDQKRLIFASEIKAIKAFGGVDLEISNEAMKEYLIYGFVPNPRTIFKCIRRIPAAHFQIIDLLEGAAGPQKYWDLPVMSPQLEGTAEDFQSEFRSLLRKSVKKRLMGQQSLGVLLSGGVDSSAIAYEASQVAVQEKLKTFSLGYLKSLNGDLKDESQFSRLVAAKIHSDHSENQVDAATASFDNLLRHFDEPVSNPTFLPKSLLFQEASRHMKVALAGYGADQIFGGSPNLQMALTVDEHLRRLRSLLNWWPFNKVNDTVKSAIHYPLTARLMSFNSAFSEKELKTFFGEQFELKMEEAEKLNHWLTGIDPSRRALYINFKYFLFDGILPIVDRTSTLNGLVVRSPYLDKDLIEFALLLPPLVRVDGRTTKSLIRSSYRKILGQEVSDRKKSEDQFPLVDFLQPKIQGEDFQKLASMGIRAENSKHNLKTPHAQKQFLALYALEGFLKQLAIGSAKTDDKLAFRSNLQSLFDEGTEGSPEWLSPD